MGPYFLFCFIVSEKIYITAEPLISPAKSFSELYTKPLQVCGKSFKEYNELCNSFCHDMSHRHIFALSICTLKICLTYTFVFFLNTEGRKN